MAVIDPAKRADSPYLKRGEQDFKVEWFNGSGKGGQHKNRHNNCARVTHLPTGLVQTASSRERTANLKRAMKEINERLDQMAHQEQHTQTAVERREQVGSGMRGDKIRTYRFQEGIVKDHRSNLTAPVSKILAEGRFDLLWEKS